MAVHVDVESIDALSREGHPALLAITSDDPRQAFFACDDAISRFNRERLGPDPWSTESGWLGEPLVNQDVVAVDVTGLNLTHLEAFLETLVDQMSASHLNVRISELRRASVPSIFPDNSGFSAGMSLIGSPYWEVPGDPGRRLPSQRMWDTDPDALSAMVDAVIAWCRVGKSGLYLLGQFDTPIGWRGARSAVERSLAENNECDIASFDGNFQRRASFYNNGYVTVDVVGSGRPAWEDCVGELTEFLVDGAELIDWGFVLQHLAGEAGLGLRTASTMHRALWIEHRNAEKVRVLGRRQDPRRHRDHVLDVYGIQVLGPGHDTTQIDRSEWAVEPLRHQRKLVTTKTLDAWFARPPSLDTLVRARHAFGDLVDPIWSPAAD